MRVVAMFRVSTERQAEEGASLDAQARKYRELAATSGWVTVAEFRGVESATLASRERRVLQEVLDCIRSDKPDALYVHELSRLSRGDELEAARLRRELREAEVKIIVQGVVRDLSSIDERFMVGIQSLVDRTEAERIQERVNRGKREKAKRGQKNSGPSPFGYRNPRPGEPGRGTLQVVPEEAEVVRGIFQAAASGTSVRAIAFRLNEQGLAAPRGGNWGRSSVKRILDNPVYIGVQASGVWLPRESSRSFRLELDNPDAIIVPDAHPPTVSREVWEEAQQRWRPVTARRPRLLTGLLWVHGVRFAGDTNRGLPFYRSADRRTGLPWLLAPQLEEAVWKAFVSLARDADFVQALIQGARPGPSRATLERELSKLDREVSRLESRRERLVDMRADGEIDHETYLRKSHEAEKSLAAQNERARALRSRIAVGEQTTSERIVQAVRTLVGDGSRLDGSQKRRILHSIVSKIEVQAEKTSGQPRSGEGQYVQRVHRVWTPKSVKLTLRLGS